MSPSIRVSVVIPTLNESSTLAATLADLAEQGPDEVVVADAGSPDGTGSIARDLGVTVIDCPRGRGVQQNWGASLTTGDVIVFLHADCRLEHGAIDYLRRFMATHPRVPGGCFRMRVDASALVYRMIDLSAHVRAAVLGMPYGDQALFAGRRAFEEAGGFPEVSLMEDVFFSLKLNKLGRIAVLPPRVIVSGRRWQSRGVVRQTLLNWSLTVGAVVGVSPSTLARFYPVVR